MIYAFISPETAVILNVMPATVDFPTCEVRCITCMQHARQRQRQFCALLMLNSAIMFALLSA